MRPVHVAQASREIMDRAFVTGMYYWIYDLRDDNTFTRDPESYEYLKAMICLRKFWLEKFGQGTFADTEGIVEKPDGIRAAVYRQEKALLLVCANTTGQEQPLAVTVPDGCSAVSYTAADTVHEAPVKWEQANGKAVLSVPAAPLSLIFLKY